MTRPASRFPTELELEILKILWKEGPLPVRAVRDALADTRDLAYTSVMTTMNIMVDKTYLTRKKKGAGFVYTPKLNQQSTASQILEDVVKRVFEGSAAAAALHLLKAGDIDEGELAALREMLNRKAEDTK
jgi:predicted transcriptional regulator